MKNRKKYFVISTLCLLFVLNACFDLDEIKNINKYSSDTVWKDVKLADAYLTDLYRTALPGGWPLNGGLSDMSPGTIGNNWMTVDNGRMFTWRYSSIRKINTLLEELSKDESTIADSDKKSLKAQAYFLRAWEYFKMVRVHGGIPIIQNVQTQEDKKALLVKRNTTKETFDFIIEDLDAAIKDLPDKAADFGRIDKIIATAFKGRVLLTKASPLFGANAAKYWSEAYTATKEAKDFATSQGKGLLDKYETVFTTDNHKEAIFAIVSNANRMNLRTEHGVRPLSKSNNATGIDAPIWSLVQSYPMKDGKKITDSGSGYNEQEFWKNRDPRFDYTIVYNAKIYPLGGEANRRQYTDKNAVNQDRFGVGDDGQNGQGVTGFYTAKGVMVSNTVDKATQSTLDWIEIRYAEVLLNYAEAANETDKINEAKEVLRQIRKRAGIEVGSGDYGMDLSSKASVRQAIKDERKIEFAFEGLRLWDLRRWKDWHTAFPTTKYGLESEVKASLGLTAEQISARRSQNQLLPEHFTYTKKRLGIASKVEEKYYFAPIRNSEFSTNENLEQNSNWGGKFNPEIE